jgi:hypothetical protein
LAIVVTVFWYGDIRPVYQPEETTETTEKNGSTGRKGGGEENFCRKSSSC